MPTSTDDRRRARAVATVIARLAAEAGRDLADDLLIWRLAGRTKPAAVRPVPADPAPTEAAPTEPAPTEPGGAPEPAAADPARADPAPADPAPADPAADGRGLARVLEAATGDERRRRTGLHVTPRWLADELVALGLDGVVRDATGEGAGPAGPTKTGGRDPVGPPTVCDPACGGGAFLLAAAEALAVRGVNRVDVVRRALWGADIDPVGLAAAEAALALWAGEAPPAGRLVVADPLRSGAAAWPDPPARGFDLVAGNPPFQSQLGRTTARAAADREALRARFGAALRPYTDTAWLFLLLACDIAAPGGRVVLVQPQSLVAARDAAVVRRVLDGRARLRRLWVEREPAFGAAVRVCAPVLEVTGRAGSEVKLAADASRGGSPTEDAWRECLAGAIGLPRVRAGTAGRLGDRSHVVAGFRDEYYGMTDLVREATAREEAALLDTCAGDVAVRGLVTSGAIGWSQTTWGMAPVRYARRRWAAPVVDLEAAPGRGTPMAARRWIDRTAGPKVLIASQTRVIEAVVDDSGRWVPSIPVVALVPREPDDVWLVAAAVLAPASTAWLARRAPGTALARDAIRVAAPDLAALPLPGDPGAWREAADVLRTLSGHAAAGSAVAGPAVPVAGDRSARDPIDRFVVAAAAAYGLGPDGDAVARWWRRRLPADAAAADPGGRADGYRPDGRRAGGTG